MSQLKQLEQDASVELLCSLFGKTRNAHYDYRRRLEQNILVQDIVLQEVHKLRKPLPGIGTRKLHFMLKAILLEHQISIGRDYLFDLMCSMGLQIKRRRRRTITTNSNHWMRKYNNLIKDIEVNRPEQVWVSDITYLRLNDSFVYLSLITDVYSHQIMGYQVQNDLSAEGCIGALNMALARRSTKDSFLIHHSDRGSQYCSKAYVELLDDKKIGISMTENGSPYENAVAERVNGILKTEFKIEENKGTMKQLKLEVMEHIHAYNNLRPHDSIQKLTPVQAHNRTGILIRNWKNYRKINWERKKQERITENASNNALCNTVAFSATVLHKAAKGLN